MLSLERERIVWRRAGIETRLFKYTPFIVLILEQRTYFTLRRLSSKIKRRLIQTNLTSYWGCIAQRETLSSNFEI